MDLRVIANKTLRVLTWSALIFFKKLAQANVKSYNDYT